MAYKKWVVRLIVIACLVALIVGGYIFVQYLTSPSQSKITTPNAPVSSLSNTSTFNNTPVVVHNAYFSFTYPASMHPYPRQPLINPFIADYSYGYRDIESWQLAVSGQTLSEPSLSNDSAYNFRSQHPEQYQLSNITINGQSVAIMTDIKSSGFSKVAFLLHGSVAVDVSLYGNDTSGTAILNGVFMHVLDTLRWITT
jgi:hypothetical protein